MLFSLLSGRVFGRALFILSLTAATVLAPGLSSRATAGVAPAWTVPVVRTTSGAVSGTTVQMMEAYLGVPYAAPPTGPLRWQPPQPHAAWMGTRAATTFAYHCPQNASPFGSATSTSEDCLYLNVFAPAGTKRGAKLPVMVWIHGGSFVDGESDDYDPDRLVARGVIVVTLNYRLGFLGFLATSGLDAEHHTHANYGLLDQQFALAWTHANIAAFGGDPARTTVFGQSAGGASVFAQLLSPGSAGLFSRAIIQSGAYDILALPTLATAEAAGNTLATALNCTQPAQQAACLRSLPVSTLLFAQQVVSSSSTPLTGGPSPAIDGTLIPQAPEDALAFGVYNHVPVMQGTNHDEFRLFTALLYDLAGGSVLTPLTIPEYVPAVQETLSAVGLGAFAGAVVAQYPLKNYASPDLAYSAFTTDAVLCTPAYVTDVLLSARTPVYAYEFADDNAPQDFLPPVSFPYGAAHGSELQFIYDSFGNRLAPVLNPDEVRLAAAMVTYWTDFAKNATPNQIGSPLWPPYVALADDMQSLVPPKPYPFTTFAPEHKVLFWAALSVTSQLSNGPATKKQYLTIDAARSAARTLRPKARHF
jgi:para-nitrobenzyl esterase